MRAIEGGCVIAVIDVLPKIERRGMCEKALMLARVLVSCDEGRYATMEHRSVVAAITKKLLRVSETVTDLGVSILWNIRESSQFAHQIKGAGAFGKLVTILQVSMNSKTKVRARYMIKLLSPSLK